MCVDTGEIFLQSLPKYFLSYGQLNLHLKHTFCLGRGVFDEVYHGRTPAWSCLIEYCVASGNFSLFRMACRCVAVGCRNTHKDGISLFLFPKDSSMRKKWADLVKTRVYNVKRHREKWEPTEHSVLCSKHFELKKTHSSHNHWV